LSTALSATVGTGNIAGVATAIAAGGPGAITETGQQKCFLKDVVPKQLKYTDQKFTNSFMEGFYFVTVHSLRLTEFCNGSHLYSHGLEL